jgi:hypothetical protein
MTGTNLCYVFTYTYVQAFHGGTILSGGWYHFSEAFHGGTILSGGGTIFRGRPEARHKVTRIDKKADLRSPLCRVVIASDAEQTAFCEPIEQRDHVASGYVACPDD